MGRGDARSVLAMARSPQTLSVEDRRIVASWAADCAEHVVAIFESAVPNDARVRAAIDQTRAFAAGELDVGDAVRRRGGQAGDAAREAPTPAATAAAYAAEQAAAVAHMRAHALGAAGYAAKAVALTGDGDRRRGTFRAPPSGRRDAGHRRRCTVASAGPRREPLRSPRARALESRSRRRRHPSHPRAPGGSLASGALARNRVSGRGGRALTARSLHAASRAR